MLVFLFQDFQFVKSRKLVFRVFRRLFRFLKACGEILLNNKYVFGGVGNIIATSFPDSVQALFTDPPQAMMHLQGNFIISSMQQEVRDHLEERVGIFPLPAIDPRWGAPLLVGGEQYIAFSDKPGVKEFLLFLTTWEACAPWAHNGGALFPHKNQDFADYGNSIDRELAEALVNTSILRFDGSDLMPTEVGSGSFWTGMVNYVTGAESAAQSLRTIEESWPQ